MVKQVTFHKRVPQGSRGTLAELMARQAEAARAATSAQDIPTPTIMQGLGKLGMVGANLFKEHRAAKAESTAREAMAKIIAGIPPEGASQQTIAELGTYDQDLAEQYRREAVAARAAAAERANTLLDRKEERIYADAREGRIDAREAQQAADALREERAHAAQTEQGIDVREAEQAAAALKEERGHQATVEANRRDYQGGIDMRNRNQALADARTESLREQSKDLRELEQQKGTETRAAELAAKVEANKRDYQGGIDIRNRNQALADDRTQFLREQAETNRKEKLEAAKPSGPLGQLMSDVEKFNNGAFGDPLDPQNQAMFKAAFAHNAAVPKGLTLKTNPDGTFSLEQGGVEAGSPTGSTKDMSLQAERYDKYLEDQKVGNDALPTIQSARKLLGRVGYQGPGGEWVGKADDLIEGVEKQFGVPKAVRSWLSLPGDPPARGMLDMAHLQQQLANVGKTVGAISNAEMGIFGRAAAGIGKNEETNELILDMAEGIIARNNLRAQRMEEYRKRPGQNDRIDAGFEAEWNDYINANPLLAEDENGMPYIIQPGEKPRETVAPDAGALPPAPPASTRPGATPAVPAQRGDPAVDQLLKEIDDEMAGGATPPGLRERLERQRAGSMGRR